MTFEQCRVEPDVVKYGKQRKYTSINLLINRHIRTYICDLVHYYTTNSFIVPSTYLTSFNQMPEDNLFFQMPFNLPINTTMPFLQCRLLRVQRFLLHGLMLLK